VGLTSWRLVYERPLCLLCFIGCANELGPLARRKVIVYEDVPQGGGGEGFPHAASKASEPGSVSGSASVRVSDSVSWVTIQ
jgi:hypothetical protein